MVQQTFVARSPNADLDAQPQSRAAFPTSLLLGDRTMPPSDSEPLNVSASVSVVAMGKNFASQGDFVRGVSVGCIEMRAQLAECSKTRKTASRVKNPSVSSCPCHHACRRRPRQSLVPHTIPSQEDTIRPRKGGCSPLSCHFRGLWIDQWVATANSSSDAISNDPLNQRLAVRCRQT